MVEYLPQAPDILTISEAAEVLRINYSSIQSLIEHGKIKCIEICGKPLILKHFLIDFLEKCCQQCYNKR